MAALRTPVPARAGKILDQLSETLIGLPLRFADLDDELGSHNQQFLHLPQLLLEPVHASIGSVHASIGSVHTSIGSVHAVFRPRMQCQEMLNRPFEIHRTDYITPRWPTAKRLYTYFLVISKANVAHPEVEMCWA